MVYLDGLFSGELLVLGSLTASFFLYLQQKHGLFFLNKNAAQHLGSSFEIDFVIVSSNISTLTIWILIFSICYYSRYLGSIAILRR